MIIVTNRHRKEQSTAKSPVLKPLEKATELTQESLRKKEGSEKELIYNYNDYRLFLKNSLAHLQKKNPSYSATAFCRQSGFTGNSRGYFGLIIKGKRNLSHRGVRGFAHTLKLSERETRHFENLVDYNQAKNEKEKKVAYKRLEKSMHRTSQSYEILASQYRYLSDWYYVVIRELINLKDFCAKEEWIVTKLKNRVNKKQVRLALKDLQTLGIIKEVAGKLVQTEKIIKFTDSSSNYTVVNNIHRDLLDLAKDCLTSDSYEKRSVSSVILGTKKEDFHKIREEIKFFREEIIEKYAAEAGEAEVVAQIGFQLLPLSQDQSKNKGEYEDKKQRGDET